MTQLVGFPQGNSLLAVTTQSQPDTPIGGNLYPQAPAALSAVTVANPSSGESALIGFPAGRRLSRAAVMLDSISANHVETVTNGLNYRSEGWFWWLNARLGWPMDLVANGGISGDTTSNFLARMDADVLSQYPDICFVLGGTNDIYNAGATAAQVIANLTKIYTQLRDAGCLVVAMTILPRTYTNATQRGYLLVVNEWIKAYARGKSWMRCADVFTALVDPTNANAEPLTTVTYDTAPRLHPNNVGAFKMSSVLVAALADLPFDRLQLVSSDAQKGSVSPTINLLENPLLIRTGGVCSSGGMTGATVGALTSGQTGVADIAQNWSVGRGTSSITATLGLVNQASGFGKAQELVVTSAGTSQDMNMISDSAHAIATASETYRAVMEIEVVAGSNALRRHMVQLLATVGGTTYTYSTFLSSSQPEVVLPGEGYTLTIPTPWFSLPAGSITNLQAQAAFRFANAGTGTVRVSRACLQPKLAV